MENTFIVVNECINVASHINVHPTLYITPNVVHLQWNVSWNYIIQCQLVNLTTIVYYCTYLFLITQYGFKIIDTTWCSHGQISNSNPCKIFYEAREYHVNRTLTLHILLFRAAHCHQSSCH